MLKGTLDAPFALSDEQRRAVEARFSEILSEDVSLEPRLDEGLLGGISVTVDGRRYDGSLRASLEDVGRFLSSARREG